MRIARPESQDSAAMRDRRPEVNAELTSARLSLGRIINLGLACHALADRRVAGQSPSCLSASARRGTGPDSPIGNATGTLALREANQVELVVHVVGGLSCGLYRAPYSSSAGDSP